MEFSFSIDMHDKDGDPYERGVLIHIGGNAIIHFVNSVELENFAKEIINSLPEIKEAEINRHRCS